jgi:hypothetical protein
VTGGEITIREDAMLTNVLLYGALVVVAVLYFMRRSSNRKTSTSKKS